MRITGTEDTCDDRGPRDARGPDRPCRSLHARRARRAHEPGVRPDPDSLGIDHFDAVDGDAVRCDVPRNVSCEKRVGNARELLSWSHLGIFVHREPEIEGRAVEHAEAQGRVLTEEHREEPLVGRHGVLLLPERNSAGRDGVEAKRELRWIE
jgi:hypothetical protein